MDKESKSNILKRLSEAGFNKSTQPYPGITDSKDIFYPAEADLAQQFKDQFTALGGIFYQIKSQFELLEQISKHCEKIDEEWIFCADARLTLLLRSAGFNRKLNNSLNIPGASLCISSCVALIARTGSVLFSSEQAEGRSHGIAPDIQIVVAFKNQLFFNVAEALEKFTDKSKSLPSMISLSSGASRTADIEKTLVMGAHGPKELLVFLLDYQNT
jgi:L-lactate dehydrogenase complex protein LldG